MIYTPPTTEDLQALRDELGLTQSQMAEYVGVAGGQQWRKYTGGAHPRHMSFHMLFYVASRDVLDESTRDAIIKRMTELGATFEQE